MTEKRPGTRSFKALAIIAALAIFFVALPAAATPIKPDIRKLVEEPQQDSAAQFIPARAGWEGPEMPQQAAVSAALEGMTGPRLARAERAELLTAATPDPRAVLGVLAVIFLLRVLRKQDEKEKAAAAARQVADEERMAA